MARRRGPIGACKLHAFLRPATLAAASLLLPTACRRPQRSPERLQTHLWAPAITPNETGSRWRRQRRLRELAYAAGEDAAPR